MVKFTITTTGFGRLLGNLKKLDFNLEETPNRTSKKIAKRIERRARENLAQGIQYKRHSPGLIAGTKAIATDRKGQWIVKSEAFDDFGRDYAPDVEFGHGGDTSGKLAKTNPIWKKIYAMEGRLHPGTYKSRTIGYFKKAIAQTRQEEKAIADFELGKTIRRSGF